MSLSSATGRMQFGSLCAIIVVASRRQGTPPGRELPRGQPLIRVELVEADEADVVAWTGLQLTVEARTGVAGEHGVPGVESLDREQVPGTAQAFDVAQAHDPVPLHLAEGKDPARAPVLGRSEYRDVDLDLGPAGRIRDYSGAHLARRAAENRGVGRDRIVAADRFEMRPCYLRQEACAGPGPDSWAATEFEACPFPAHDGLIKGDKRLGDAVFRPSRSE